jgi:hypothetical protein
MGMRGNGLAQGYETGIATEQVPHIGHRKVHKEKEDVEDPGIGDSKLGQCRKHHYDHDQRY